MGRSRRVRGDKEYLRHCFQQRTHSVNRISIRTAGARSAMASPLALICAHKRVVVNGHGGELTGLCLDGDFAVTAGWDGELRVWGEHSGSVSSSFAACAQRIRGYRSDTPPCAVTALTTVADGYLVSGSLDGTCAIWSRHGHRNPLHPTLADGTLTTTDSSPEKNGAETNENEKADVPSAAEPPADPSTSVPEPTEDEHEEGINAEQAELRIAAKLKWRNEEQYRGPYARVGAFFDAANADGVGATTAANETNPCTVRAILPLYARSGNPESNDSNARATLPPISEEAKQTPPRYLVLATSHALGGGLAVGAFVKDVSDGLRTVDFLSHPEGVTCALVDQSAFDGKDRIVTGCLDGRVRVWAAIGFTEVSVDATDTHQKQTEQESDKAYETKCQTRTARYATSLRSKRASSKFVLEKTFENPHRGYSVTCVGWLGAHPSFPPPYRPPPPTAKEFDNDPPPAESSEETRAGIPVDWQGKDSALYFLSGGADGSVRMWELKLVTRNESVDTARNETIGASTNTEITHPEYVWDAEFGDPEITDAPAAPRVAKELRAHKGLANCSLLFENNGIKSLNVFGGKIVAGLADGTICAWGHRVFDNSGVHGWCLEKVTDPHDGRNSAVTTLSGCGLNMVVGTADGKMHIYA